jgi:hypothetical protein
VPHRGSDPCCATPSYDLQSKYAITKGVQSSLSQDVLLTHYREAATALTTANWTLPPAENRIGGPTWFTGPGDTTKTHPGASSSNPKDPALTDVRDWACKQIFDTIHPYNQLAPSTEYSSITDFTDSGYPLHTVFFISGAQFPGGHSPTMPRCSVSGTGRFTTCPAAQPGRARLADCPTHMAKIERPGAKKSSASNSSSGCARSSSAAWRASTAVRQRRLDASLRWVQLVGMAAATAKPKPAVKPMTPLRSLQTFGHEVIGLAGGEASQTGGHADQPHPRW